MFVAIIEVPAFPGIQKISLILEDLDIVAANACSLPPRSEERRVGKECRSRWSPYH